MEFYKNSGYSSDFPITATIYQDLTSLPHWHPETELMLVQEGSIGMGKNSEYRVLNKGEIALCSSGDIHYYESEEKHSSILVIVFRQELIWSMVKMPNDEQSTITFLDTAAVKAIGMDKAYLDEMRSCMDSIYKEIRGQEKDYQLVVKAKLVNLFALFSRHIPKSASLLDGKMAGPKTIKLIQGALKYIETNYSQDISLEDISDYLNVTHCYFSSVFSKITGLTFKNYLNKARIAKAHHLLKTSNMSVTDIAFLCGYNSLRTFNRTFRAVKGFAPSSLRHESYSENSAGPAAN